MIENVDTQPCIHLVVVELQHHSDILKNLYDVLSLSYFRITLVTLPEIYDSSGLERDSDDEALSVYLKRNKESISDFIDRTTPVFESADVVYFNTVLHYWKDLSKIPLNAVSIVRIHNAHCDLAPATHFYRPLISGLGILSHLIRKILIGGEWRLKKQFFDRIDYFMFPNQSITDYVKENGWVDQGKILKPVLPFGYLGERRYEPEDGDDQTVTVAITGKVTNRKKDYTLVFEALQRCLNNLRYPLKLVLLGKADDKDAASIIKDFKKLESKIFSLDYSKEYVPAGEFDRKVASVDFFVAPIQVDIRHRRYREVYGKSKMSGVENDILVFRKPSLVVSYYRVNGELEKVVGYFDKNAESLGSQIQEWVNQRVFEDKRGCFENIVEYRRGVIAERFYQLCSELMERKSKSSQEV